MGNSCGGLDEYWAAIRAHPGLQGGFAWDWVDQALVQELADGSRRLAYGGDFGDDPNDGQFCMNGLVSADRTPHPSLLEMAKVVQPVQVRAVDAARGVLEVTNEHAFVDLSWLRPTWVVEVDGDRGRLGRARAARPRRRGRPRRSASRCPSCRSRPASGRTSRSRFRTMADLPWAPAGHVVAWEQFEIASAPGPTCAPGPIATADARRPRSVARAVAGTDRQRDLRPAARGPLGPARPARPGRARHRHEHRRRGGRRRARRHPRGRRARHARRHPAGGRAARHRRRRARGRVARRGSARVLLRSSGERPLRALDHRRRRLARALRAPAGQRQPRRRPLAPAPRRRRDAAADHRPPRRPAGHRLAAGPTRSSPTPPTSRTCRCGTAAGCGSMPRSAASARAHAARTPRPRTGSVPATIAGRTASAEILDPWSRPPVTCCGPRTSPTPGTSSRSRWPTSLGPQGCRLRTSAASSGARSASRPTSTCSPAASSGPRRCCATPTAP